mmetsp:Transcript_34274/g.91549  ORF Transcript_34274/g.91549 Transcript_34274/m.91549 type:complete len:269 (+) Transcript_34274:132-938(+)
MSFLLLWSHPNIHTSWLQCFVIIVRRHERLFGVDKRRICLDKSHLLRLPLLRFVLNLLRLGCLRHFCISCEHSERLGRFGLGGGRFGFQPCKIALDHLKEPDDIVAARLIAMVRIGPSAWCTLDGTRLGRHRLTRLGIKHSQYLDCLCEAGLGVLGVLDRRFVRCLLLAAQGCRVDNLCLEFGHLSGQLRNLHRELLNRSFQLVDSRVEFLDGGSLLLSGLRIRCQLGVTPALVSSFGCRLLHQVRDQIVNHVSNLGEGIRFSLGGQC